MKNKVIIFGTKKRSGKDTASDFLVKEFNYIKLSFAAKFKSILKYIYLLSDEQLNGNLKDIIDERYNVTPRYIMQFFGESCRKIHPFVWSQDLFENQILHYNKLGYYKFCITDLRLPNEIEYAKNWAEKTSSNIILVKINRMNLNFSNIDTHETEQSLDNYKNWDFVINNDSDLATFKTKILTELQCIL